MTLDSIIPMITQVLKCPYFQILSTLWLTYSYVIFKGGHVSDDLAGIEQYDGTLMYPNDEGKKDDKGNIIGWAKGDITLEQAWNMQIGLMNWLRPIALREAGVDVDFVTEKERKFQATLPLEFRIRKPNG